jgi:hypothetical protein
LPASENSDSILLWEDHQLHTFARRFPLHNGTLETVSKHVFATGEFSNDSLSTPTLAGVAFGQPGVGQVTVALFWRLAYPRVEPR